VSTRYIAQRVLTGEVIDWAVPIATDGGTQELSAVGSLSGTVAPDTGAMRARDGRLVLEEWGTFLYEETDDEIRWGGLVISSGWKGREWSVECAGFTTYATGTPFTGELVSASIDPVDVVRRIWADVQAGPDSDLGLTVVGPTSTGVRLGTAEDPYELVWYNTPDCGRELSDLAKDAPFDFTERHYWQGDTIRHEFVIGYPRLGRRRTDLTFLQGVNITANIEPGIGGDDFANGVIGLGAGEGRGAVRRETSKRDGRLRRTKVLAAKDVTQEARLDAIIRDELQRRQSGASVASITVVDHPNARVGSWAIGDDILVTGELPWLGRYEEWHRIIGWAPSSPTRGVLKLALSDSFTYGGTA